MGARDDSRHAIARCAEAAVSEVSRALEIEEEKRLSSLVTSCAFPVLTLRRIGTARQVRSRISLGRIGRLHPAQTNDTIQCVAKWTAESGNIADSNTTLRITVKGSGVGEI